MSFRTFFFGMDHEARAVYAQRAGSTVGYLSQVAYGNKEVELGLADALVAVAGGALELGDIPLTDRAQRQHVIRRPVVEVAPAQREAA